MRKAVLHILWSGRFGGIAKLVYDLACAQSQNDGLRIGVLIAMAEGYLAEEFGNARLPCAVADLRHGVDVSPAKFRRLLDVCQDYDILHLHGFNPVVALAAVRSGRQIVYTEHGNFGFGRKVMFREHVVWALQRWFLNHCVHYITFNSQFSRQCAEQRYGLQNVPRKVIYNGIDFRASERAGQVQDELARSLEGKFVVGTTSRFAGVKRIDLLIEAFASFQVDRDTMLVLVGDGVLRGQLERQVARLGVQEKVVFTGYRENVTDFQRLMNVCVFPSQNEAFGLVAVETLALGKPTVVFADGGGIIEVMGDLADEDTVGDVRQLIERLAYYYDHRDEIDRKSALRQEHARRFSIERTEKQFAAAYRAL